MSDPTNTMCPLCLKPATVFGTTNAGLNKALDCKGCGKFAVSDKADAKLRTLPDQFKDDWRAKIRATTLDELFVIITRLVGSESQIEGQRVPRNTIQSLP